MSNKKIQHPKLPESGYYSVYTDGGPQSHVKLVNPVTCPPIKHEQKFSTCVSPKPSLSLVPNKPRGEARKKTKQLTVLCSACNVQGQRIHFAWTKSLYVGWCLKLF